jgi:hypothetical protein
VIVTVWGELLVPTFSLLKLRVVGEEVSTGGGTVTGTDTRTPWAPWPYVAVMEALPVAIAVTTPLLSTVAMLAFDDVYAIFDDTVKSATLPSANVPEIRKGTFWPCDWKLTRTLFAFKLVGRSALSTSMVTGLDPWT